MADTEYTLVDGAMPMLLARSVAPNWLLDVSKARETWCGGKSWKHGRSKITLL